MPITLRQLLLQIIEVRANNFFVSHNFCLKDRAECLHYESLAEAAERLGCNTVRTPAPKLAREKGAKNMRFKPSVSTTSSARPANGQKTVAGATKCPKYSTKGELT